MKPQFPRSDTSIQLSSIDQFASRTYSSLLLPFAFRWTNNTFTHFQTGLSAALNEFPDYAATVTGSSTSAKNELELKLGPDSGVYLALVSQQNWTYGSYAELQEKHFPLSGIPTHILLSREAAISKAPSNAIPAFLAQINVLDGGIILGISWHHSVSDARAVSMFAECWAQNTRLAAQGQPLSASSLPDRPPRDGASPSVKGRTTPSQISWVTL